MFSHFFDKVSFSATTKPWLAEPEFTRIHALLSTKEPRAALVETWRTGVNSEDLLIVKTLSKCSQLQAAFSTNQIIKDMPYARKCQYIERPNFGKRYELFDMYTK